MGPGGLFSKGECPALLGGSPGPPLCGASQGTPRAVAWREGSMGTYSPQGWSFLKPLEGAVEGAFTDPPPGRRPGLAQSCVSRDPVPWFRSSSPEI